VQSPNLLVVEIGLPMDGPMESTQQEYQRPHNAAGVGTNLGTTSCSTAWKLDSYS